MPKIRKKQAYFIGICGVGMASTALLLKEAGWKVSGSDEDAYPPVSSYLKSHLIAVKTPHSPSHIPKDADLIVIGKHAKLDPKENNEVKAALEHPAPKKSFPEVLADITRNRRVVVVAGSSGKSTCTALMAWCLACAGHDPGYFVGAVPISKSTKKNEKEYTPHGTKTGKLQMSHNGKSDIFIIEGDEYPTSHFDARSKFLHFVPNDLLVTGVSHDHVNVFPTLRSYQKQFIELRNRVSRDGIIVCHESARGLFTRETSLPPVTYSVDDPSSDWYAKDIRYGKVSSFALLHKGKRKAIVKTTLLGKHNIENIIGVSAYLFTERLLNIETLQNAVETFPGLKRRLELKTEKSRVSVYEGFGSSYAKAKSAIEAMKLHFPDKHLIVIFEPHTFSWRNKKTLHWYDNVFEEVENIILFSPPEHGASTHAQVSLEEILARIAKSGKKATGVRTENELRKALNNAIDKNNSVILILTSGTLDGHIEHISKYIEQKSPL